MRYSKMFMDYVEKVLVEARKEKTLVERVQYLFTNAPGITERKAKDMTEKEVKDYATFFKLLDKSKTFVRVRHE